MANGRASLRRKERRIKRFLLGNPGKVRTIDNRPDSNSDWTEPALEDARSVPVYSFCRWVRRRMEIGAGQPACPGARAAGGSFGRGVLRPARRADGPEAAPSLVSRASLQAASGATDCPEASPTASAEI